MLNNKDIKLIRSLQQKKYRQKYNYFVVEGEKMSIEAIKFYQKEVFSVFCLQNFYSEHQDILKSLNADVNIIDESQLKKISTLKTPNAALVLMYKPAEKSLENINAEESEIVLFLDRIQDPGNMGTIIRTCDWFGIKDIIISPGSVDIYNPKVVQASMGGILRIDFYNADFLDAKTILGNTYSFYGTLLNGESIYEVQYDFPIVLVVGNESKGISTEIISELNKSITIPGRNTSSDSLNVAVATGISVSYMARKLMLSE